MSISKTQISDALEHFENFLTDSSSFEELFDKVEQSTLLDLIQEDDEKLDLIEELIEEDEYSHFMKEYLTSLEFVIKNLDEKEFYDFVYEIIFITDGKEFLDEDNNIDIEAVKNLFSW